MLRVYPTPEATETPAVQGPPGHGAVSRGFDRFGGSACSCGSGSTWSPPWASSASRSRAIGGVGASRRDLRE